MERQQSRAILQIVRFGLPVIVGLFYVTSARGFDFTADSAYTAASWADALRGVSAIHPSIAPFSPLWSVLIALGGMIGLDPLLVAKILSLVFGCFALLALYLLSVEVLEDRILSFCVTLIFALDPWLLQAGPSGSATSLLLALSLASLFFLKRGDFALSSLLGGLAALTAWPAALLFLCLVPEVFSARSGTNSGKILLASALVFFSVLLPWGLFAAFRGTPLLPLGVEAGGLPSPSWPTAIVLLLFLLVIGSGFVQLRRAPLLRLLAGRSPLFLGIWCAWSALAGLLWERDLWLAGLAALAVLAGRGLQNTVRALREDPPKYTAAFLATCALLVLNQVSYLTVSHRAMALAVEDQEEVRVIAHWMKSQLHGPMVVESHYPGMLGLLLGEQAQVEQEGPVLHAPYAVLGRRKVEGYEELFRPSPVDPDASGFAEGHLGLFRRKAQEP
jgi:hypothetical protein